MHIIRIHVRAAINRHLKDTERSIDIVCDYKPANTTYKFEIFK